jgi:hypothetical protein
VYCARGKGEIKCLQRREISEARANVGGQTTSNRGTSECNRHRPQVRVTSCSDVLCTAGVRYTLPERSDKVVVDGIIHETDRKSHLSCPGMVRVVRCRPPVATPGPLYGASERTRGAGRSMRHSVRIRVLSIVRYFILFQRHMVMVHIMLSTRGLAEHFSRQLC